jgi:hypothetical protein
VHRGGVGDVVAEVNVLWLEAIGPRRSEDGGILLAAGGILGAGGVEFV